ncbi:hypothetical protein D5086_029258 [Populus alba]|uniref:Uncharacterized protein n=1 Tax=Populus alba TaxID=43335 RepID=A0ACC4ASZ3_POPAL
MDPASRYRFLGIPSSTSSSSSLADGNGDSNGNGDELNEDDILWTNDYTDQSLSNSSSSSPTTTSANNLQSKSNHLTAFPKNSGILAALPETNHNTVLYRKPSLQSSSSASSSSSSRAIPLIPRSPHVAEYASQSVPIRKLNQSAPMNVPVLSIAMAKQRNSRFKEDDDGEFDGDEEMLPPHEIVARGSRRSPKTTFSVLEGVGRTLKGRDLRQVRNAVWRQTGVIIYHTLQDSFEDEAIALQWLSIGIVTFECGDDFEFDRDEEMLLPREIEAVVFWCLKGQVKWLNTNQEDVEGDLQWLFPDLSISQLKPAPKQKQGNLLCFAEAEAMAATRLHSL